MKKSFQLILLIMAILSLTLPSCKKNEANPSSTELIIGKWKLISSSYKEYENNVLVDSSFSNAEWDIYFAFKLNGICTIESDDPDGFYTLDYEYDIIKGEIIFSSDNETFTCKIKELSQSTLVIEETITEGGDYKTITKTTFKRV